QNPENSVIGISVIAGQGVIGNLKVNRDKRTIRAWHEAFRRNSLLLAPADLFPDALILAASTHHVVDAGELKLNAFGGAMGKARLNVAPEPSADNARWRRHQEAGLAELDAAQGRAHRPYQHPHPGKWKDERHKDEWILVQHFSRNGGGPEVHQGNAHAIAQKSGNPGGGDGGFQAAVAAGLCPVLAPHPRRIGKVSLQVCPNALAATPLSAG